jgi:hypothetical protein
LCIVQHSPDFIICQVAKIHRTKSVRPHKLRIIHSAAGGLAAIAIAFRWTGTRYTIADYCVNGIKPTKDYLSQTMSVKFGVQQVIGGLNKYSRGAVQTGRGRAFTLDNCVCIASAYKT